VQQTEYGCGMTDIFASLLLAAIGAAITFAAAFGKRRVRNRQLRRRYPVAGLFTTEFEDQDGSRLVVEKGLTRLRQRGMEIRGVTSELQFGRCWELEGTVSSGGFVHGLYRAEDPHDSGMGTFFLRIDATSGDMEGLWAGYDSVNQSLNGGRYTFRRCPEVEIRKAASSEYEQIVALLGDALGDRYIGIDQLEQMGKIHNETCFVAISEERVAGAAITRLVESVALAQVFPLGQEQVLNEVPLGQYHRTVGVVGAVAVALENRGRGVGTQLTRASMDWLRDRGATAAVSFGWKSSNGCHIAGVLRSCGFEERLEITEFWTKESASTGYSCPECGNLCKCSAIIFTRSLTDLPSVQCRV